MNFESMFSAIHGCSPFPWQSEAARRLVEGEVFAAVDVPTACGKTAMIDAAVFSAAHGGPRRIAFIIDRRVVVDEAYARAQRIASALANPSMKELSKRLGPVQVVRLRGGVYGDDDWFLYPERVTVIVSTVDQVGSRLLHRGYGVSPRMAPIHAGFVGNNALYITDEAHLSTAFIETVEAARRYGADVRLITMTATPVADKGATVRLSLDDLANPVLSRRLQASKRAQLMIGDTKESDFVKKAVSAAEKLSESARIIGVVVNRVVTARNIHQALIKRKHRAELLTGRVRPYDRDHLMDRLLPEIRAGRVRTDGEILFIVSTQTVEVGADIDFDALLTEAAPLDSLRQRFGRQDRLGELGDTQGVVLYREPKLNKNKEPIPDPVYGMATHDAWEWLQTVAEDGCINFGVAAIADTIQRLPPPVIEAKHGPTLLPAHIKLFSQTGPEAPEFDVSPWLHGAGSGAPDVSIVWRADLPPGNNAQWVEVVGLRPPLTREALEIPIYAARSWLRGRRPQDITDLEGVALKPPDENALGRPVLCWRGPDDCKVLYPRDVRPGDTLVVPAQYGGCDIYGWAPNKKRPVEDIADFCSLERQKNHVVRLVPGLMNWLGSRESQIHEAVTELISAETEVDPEMGIDENRVKTARSGLRALLAEVDHPFIIAFRRKFVIERHPAGVVLRGRVIDEINVTFSGGVRVELDHHLEGVARQADMLGAGHPESQRISMAALQHDLGKTEPRFQTMLHGDPIAAALGPTLAKSGLRKLSEIRAAYTESGLPAGFRHELASLAQSGESERLVRHLIGTHHGYGRPWFPVCVDPEAPGAKEIWLGSSWAQTFAELVDKHGPWAMAGMELLLRVSDIRQSILEQENKDA